MASAETDWDTACVGSGRYVPLDRTELSLEGQWIAECPDCGQILELGYAGFLPVHAAVIAATDDDRPAGSVAGETTTSDELVANRS